MDEVTKEDFEQYIKEIAYEIFNLENKLNNLRVLKMQAYIEYNELYCGEK